MYNISNKNTRLNSLKLTRNIHWGINDILLQVEVTPLDIANMKIAPITFVGL